VVTRKGLLCHPLLKLGFAVKSGGNKSRTHGGSSPIMEESQGTFCCRTSQRFIICKDPRGNCTVSQRHHSPRATENKPTVLSEALRSQPLEAGKEVPWFKRTKTYLSFVAHRCIRCRHIPHITLLAVQLSLLNSTGSCGRQRQGTALPLAPSRAPHQEQQASRQSPQAVANEGLPAEGL